MEDILSQGGDQDPSPWPRRLAVIAAVIAVIAGGAVYLTRPHHQAPAAAHRASPSPAASAVLTVPPGPNGILGQTLAWDRGLRLPDAGDQPAWFSPASGGAEPIGGLPAVSSGYQFTRVSGGWAVQAGPAAGTSCGGCAGPPIAVWFLPDGARSVTRLGTANRVAPAATAGTVWLTSYAPGDKPAVAAGTAREAGAGTSAGTAAARPVRLPPGYAIAQGTARGLLLEPLSARPGAPAGELWDPGTGRTSRTFDKLLAVSPAEVAWASGCTPRCGVRALNLSTGEQTTVTLPAGSSVTSASFSPDSEFIALQVSFGNTGDGGELAMQLEVAPVSGGRLTPVPGTWVSSDALVGFGWPGGGDSLVAEFSFTTKMQLASWQPGASRPAVTVVKPGPDQAALILG